MSAPTQMRAEKSLDAVLLSALRRTRSGNFDLGRSVTVEAMRELGPVELGAKLISLPEVSRLRGA